MDSTLPQIRTAIISIHGAGRNANEHYTILATATSELNLLDSTLIVAPLYLEENSLDTYNLDSTVLYWPSSDWNAGDLSRNTDTHPRPQQISAFATLDTFYYRLVQNCPNLERLVLTGHSAGSQMVVRYAAGGRAQSELQQDHDIRFCYIQTNTPSFLYLDSARVVNESSPPYQFQPFGWCWSANYYKYGLDYLNQYMEESGVEFIRTQYREKDIVYLIGQYDTGGQSTNCARDIQGNNRLRRSYIFFAYLGYYYGDTIYSNQKLAVLPSVDHDFWEVVNSDCGLNTVFDLGVCNAYVYGPNLYNARPIADAGEDQVVAPSATVLLDGTSSVDPDGTLSSVQWSQYGGTSVLLSQANTLTASFQAPGVNDSLVFILSVTDNEGLNANDTTTVFVDGVVALVDDCSSDPGININIYPNPFNTTTTIALPPGLSRATVDIYDLRGRHLKNIVHSQNRPMNTTLQWNGKDESGHDAGTGMFIVRIRTGNHLVLRKVTILK